MDYLHDDFKGALWAARYEFTQTNAGGGNILANFIAQERTLLLFGSIGRDVYAGDRTVQVRVNDGDPLNIIAYLLFPSPINNETVTFPKGGAVAVAGSVGGEFEKRVLLGKGDTLTVVADALAQNEVLSVQLRALVRHEEPTVNTTGSSGTVTTTVREDGWR